MLTILARACGLFLTLAWSMPGSTRSPVYSGVTRELSDHLDPLVADADRLRLRADRVLRHTSAPPSRPRRAARTRRGPPRRSARSRCSGRSCPRCPSLISATLGLGLRCSRSRTDRIIPPVQNPHWTAWLRAKAAWIVGQLARGRPRPRSSRPSPPSASAARTRQELTVLPFRKTVQAPHSPAPQPSFVPVSPTLVPQEAQQRPVLLDVPLVDDDR